MGMKRGSVIFAPDSFKGTLSSPEVCVALAAALARICPELRGIALPIADGGEGTAECFLAACGGVLRRLRVHGPLDASAEGFYAALPDGTAVVEMAAAAGLPLAGDDKNPELATTYGVGELMGDALENGAKKLILALGGSATNDGGAGMAAALGVRFLDESGKEFLPVGGTLRRIAAIDPAPAARKLSGVSVTVMCDVTNPLCGENGAAAVYAPQKGADSEMVKRLDAGLSHLAEMMLRDMGVDIRTLPGTGAAGGMGGGAVAFLNGTLVSGIDVMLDAAGFDKLLADAVLVLTGEGRIDGQSAQGKAVAGIARRARERNVPVVVIAGDIGEDIEPLYKMGVSAVFSTNRVAAPYSEQKKRARRDIELTAETVFRMLRL